MAMAQAQNMALAWAISSAKDLEIFKIFPPRSTAVRPHVVLDPERSTLQGYLTYKETLPPETLP